MKVLTYVERVLDITRSLTVPYPVNCSEEGPVKMAEMLILVE